jgi:3-oxoacyl-[acyl-carrier protein] reductase
MSELVLITGATGGIGRAVAARLAHLGLVPVIGYRAAKEAEALALAASCRGFPVTLDMADSGSIDNVLAALADDNRRLAGVVLAASPPPVLAPFGRVMAGDHERFWTVNVIGNHRLLSGLVKRCFRKHHRGSVVAVLSKAMGGAGRAAMPNMGAYTISKFGLQGVMALLAAEFPWLHTSVVRPGFTETPMLQAFDARFLDLLRQRESFANPAALAIDIVDRLALMPRGVPDAP